MENKGKRIVRKKKKNINFYRLALLLIIFLLILFFMYKFFVFAFNDIKLKFSNIDIHKMVKDEKKVEINSAIKKILNESHLELNKSISEFLKKSNYTQDKISVAYYSLNDENEFFVNVNKEYDIPLVDNILFFMLYEDLVNENKINPASKIDLSSFENYETDEKFESVDEIFEKYAINPVYENFEVAKYSLEKLIGKHWLIEAKSRYNLKYSDKASYSVKENLGFLKKLFLKEKNGYKYERTINWALNKKSTDKIINYTRLTKTIGFNKSIKGKIQLDTGFVLTENPYIYVIISDGFEKGKNMEFFKILDKWHNEYR